MFFYLQSIQAYISPPIAAVFLLGLFFKWINARGAIVSLWAGFIIGIIRLVAEYMNKEGVLNVTPDSLLGVFLEINFLHFAIFLFVFCTGVMMIVSRLGVPQPEGSLQMVTFQRSGIKTKFEPLDIALTAILILAVLIMWIVFSPFGIA